MGHVYILKADRRWKGKILVKIGMTSKRNVYDRASQIQQEWMRDRRIRVDYVTSFQAQTPREVESVLHREWSHRSVYGKAMRAEFGGGDCSGDTEWFALSSQEFRSLCGHGVEETSGYWIIVTAIAGLAAAWALFFTTPRKPIPQINAPNAPLDRRIVR